MEKLSIGEILEATNGTLINTVKSVEKIYIDSVSIDSRKMGPNSLFIPLHGENVNSHNFILDAFTNGAVATLTDEDLFCAKGKIFIKVDDTLVALQKLASFYRSKFEIPVVGITGSVGKTTTKEMISCVLESRYNVLKTAGNLNGQVGLPLTLFNLNKNHQIAVIEMGISMPNEMCKLTKIAKNNCAVISNIGITHIENFNSQEDIFAEKLKIVETLDENSTLFVNSDNLTAEIVHKYCKGNFNIKRFSIKNQSDFCAKNIVTDGQNTLFDFIHNNQKEQVIIPVLGNHNVYNALSAIAVGLEFGLTMGEIKAALKEYKSLKMRQHICDVKINQKNITIIDDTYNANPDSMKSSLEVLASFGQNRRKIAVLADMLELGEFSQRLHYEIGQFAANKDIDVILAIGQNAQNFIVGALDTLENDNLKIAENACAATYYEDINLTDSKNLERGETSFNAEGQGDVTGLCNSCGTKLDWLNSNIVSEGNLSEKGVRNEIMPGKIANYTKNIHAVHFSNNEDCFKYLYKMLKNEDVILLKGSRGMHLEEIVNKLVEKS